MELPADFFAPFPPVTKAGWIDRIARDLKGRPVEELYWHVSETWTADPFAHADDFAEPPVPLNAAPLRWEIGEDVDAADPAAANARALEALEGGAESLRFSLETPATAADLRRRLQGIYLDFISLHFAGPGLTQNPGAVFGVLGILAGENELDPKTLRGALDWDPASATGLQDWRYWADLMAHAGENWPGFTLVGLDSTPDWRGAAGAPDELAALLRRAQVYFKKGAERGLPASAVAAQMQFSIVVGPSYFVEIAKLRAFRLLWFNVLNAWGLPPAEPAIDARFAPGAYTADRYANLIRSTTMAMSAVLGGARRLTVAPYDTGDAGPGDYPPAFGRRMARNVQQLLAMESFFSEMPDPAAGSYYLEKLTLDLARTAWEKFQQS